MSEVERTAHQAGLILENPAWQQAWDRLERELWLAFQDTSPDDTPALRSIATRRWALAIIRAELERMLAQPLLDKLNAE
jgi:hypothetical protein